MKNKMTALLSVGALSLSLLAPTASGVSANADSSADYSNWNVERYGDRVDIDGMLEKKSQSEEFQKKAVKEIKEAAEEVNFNEAKSSESNEDNSTSTYEEGETKLFLDRNLAFQEYTLRSVGEHVEIWVANDLSFGEGDPRDPHVVTQEQVNKMAAEFDSNIYPKATDFFGMPDSLDGTNAQLEDLGLVPEGYYEGDGDKVMIHVSNIPDENFNNPDYPFFVAGFFWQTLENYTDRNIISIDSADWEERLESTFFATTIHELQHLIHADNDGDETTWLNEGMSTFSEFLGGYGLGTNSINFLLDHPENSLTSWDEHVNAATGPETIADYALVQLFTVYNYERFGQEFIRHVAVDEENSIASFEQAYKDFGLNVTFNEVYQDFSTALVVDDDKFKGGKYGFENIDLREIPVEDGSERGFTVNFEKAKTYEKDGVPAWGTDFKEFNFAPNQNVENFKFNGIDFLPLQWESVQDPLGSDDQVYWAGKGNELDNKMIFDADLTGVNEATLTFDNFIDIEERWDFGMVQVSTDNGETWTSLENENTRSDVVENGYPTIKENVPGFTGHYEDFQKEAFDLSEYAGEEVLISFRYLTDWGYNDSGWFIDDISIPEIGLSYDGTSTEDFMSEAQLKEEYVNYGVTFIKEKNNGKFQVIEVDPFNVTDEEALELQQAFRKGKTYMTTYYAAPLDSTIPVPFEYEVEFKENNGKGPKKN
ncbi:immune inhibitor A domain-containing protein [Halobacillus amylolyticus]|uniref:Immune inhibitor A n=1 Tax=Halobacillus amylolyticus TaxID=2932259 RepID=A0ABY4HA40_9BACI|nr:immune inhibitor A domain-containing protein [Halobacillus amylolyticus]UOR11163.1 immune inhibitor A [Halobacillus amylolyticus]